MKRGYQLKVSTKTRYGMRILVELAERWGEGSIKREVISQSQDIPLPYLENILTILRRSSFVETKRGATGGIQLTREPEKIGLLTVFNSLEGTLAVVKCVDIPDCCDRENLCKTQKLWKRLKDSQEDILRNMTLADLMVDTPDFGSKQAII